MTHHHLTSYWPFRYCMTLLSCFLVLTGCALLGIADTGFDFDGDNHADLSVFRPQTGVWYVNKSTGGFSAFHFGQDGDIPVAQDYDADGKADAAVYRSGVWYRLKSATNTWDVIPFGTGEDIPSPADFDGDRKADIAVFRPSTGDWHTLLSLNNSYSVSKFGQTGDLPIPADFDGDHRADIAVFRPQNGTWHHLNSSSGGSYVVRQFGSTGDTPLTADFDGDSKSDLAVWRPADCNWYIQDGLGSVSIVHFGISTDSPVPADYDGDGRSDISIYRPNGGYWYRINSSSSTLHVEQFGLALDIPVPELRRPRNQPNPPPTPTPSPTATPSATPTPTPSPTPTPGPPTFSCDYYASPTGTSSGNGSISSPWDLQTALNKTTLVTSGKTLCLRGGTYLGKFRTQLSTATVRSAPGEWAKIDGYRTTVLPTAITATQTTFSVQNASGVLDGGSDELVIGGEVIKVFGKNGNNITGSLRGASNSLNGAEPHASNSTVIFGGDVLYVSGTGATYRDFEILNSRPSRNGNTENQGIGRGNGVTVVGMGNRLVNLIIHDNLSGIMTSGASANTEIYGCLIYNNGMHAVSDGVEQGLGHGMYLENSLGFSKVYEDIVFNNFNLGMQGYGVTAPYVGGDISGTVISNSGSPLGKFGDVNRRNYNLILGPDSQISPTGVIRDSHFFHPMSTNGYSVKFGYGAGVGVGTITGNYFVGGGTLFEIANTPSANVSGNHFYSSRSGAVYAITQNGMPYAWNGNVYHSGLGRDVFGVAATGIYQFSAWRTLTGFDQSGSATATAMPNTVIVRPNAYKAGRANVLIYSPGAASTATINLSLTGLVNGQGYTIRNGQDYFGAAIASGTYSAQNPNVVVAISGPALTVAAPTGYGFTPATTCPQFCPMVVVPN